MREELIEGLCWPSTTRRSHYNLYRKSCWCRTTDQDKLYNFRLTHVNRGEPRLMIGTPLPATSKIQFITFESFYVVKHRLRE